MIEDEIDKVINKHNFDKRSNQINKKNQTIIPHPTQKKSNVSLSHTVQTKQTLNKLTAIAVVLVLFAVATIGLWSPYMMRQHHDEINTQQPETQQSLYTGDAQKTTQTFQIYNPYEQVNFNTVNHYKANLHTHTMTNKVETDGTVIFADGRTLDPNGVQIQAGDPNWNHHDNTTWHQDYNNSNGVKHGSDGWVYTDKVIENYSNAEYAILAITDHSINSWPWTNWINNQPVYSTDSSAFFADLGANGILAISGNEPSTNHHHASLLNDYAGNGANLDESFQYIKDNNGLSMFYHPGRYTNIYRDGYNARFTPQWYNDYFDVYNDILLGMEVFNQGNRYGPEQYDDGTFEGDVVWWDTLNRKRSPDNLIWGFSNDDFHKIDNAFKNYQHLLMDNLDESEFRTAMKNGAFYFSYEPHGENQQSPTYGQANTPTLTNVIIQDNIITIHGQNYDQIRWFDEYTTRVGTGNSIDVSQIHSTFVRAVLINQHGETYTQPFGYEKEGSIRKPVVHIGDFNGDGYKDILLQNRFLDNGPTYILYGTSDGEFLPAIDITDKYLMSSSLWSSYHRILHIGDFNGNGCDDILLQARKPSGHASYLLLGQPDNTFSNALSVTNRYDMTAEQWSAAQQIIHIGDFNGDGRDDILLQNKYKGGSTYLLQAQEPQQQYDYFKDKENITTQYKMSSSLWSDHHRKISLGDFNGDSATDILLQNRQKTGHASYLLISNADGTFKDQFAISNYYDMSRPNWSYNTREIYIGDFNGDGKDDILLQNRNLTGDTFLLIAKEPQNHPNYRDYFHDKTIITNSFGMSSSKWSRIHRLLHIGDFNADGCTDILLQNIKPQYHSSYMLLGRKNTQPHQTFTNNLPIDTLFEMDREQWSDRYRTVYIGEFSSIHGDLRDDILLIADCPTVESILLHASQQNGNNFLNIHFIKTNVPYLQHLDFYPEPPNNALEKPGWELVFHDEFNKAVLDHGTRQTTGGVWRTDLYGHIAPYMPGELEPQYYTTYGVDYSKNGTNNIIIDNHLSNFVFNTAPDPDKGGSTPAEPSQSLSLVYRKEPGLKYFPAWWWTDENLPENFYRVFNHPQPDGNKEAIYGPMEDTSGWIESNRRFLYGYFEIRCTIPNEGITTFPAFWLWNVDQTEPYREIDIFEFNGYFPDEDNLLPNTPGFNMHIGIENHKDPVRHYPSYYQLQGGPYASVTDHFHTYAVRWTPNVVVYYVDNVERYRIEGDSPYLDMRIIANLAACSNFEGWPHGYEFLNLPKEMEIDYIRAYRSLQKEFLTTWTNTVDTHSINENGVIGRWILDDDLFVTGNFLGDGIDRLLAVNPKKGAAHLLYHSPHGWQTTWQNNHNSYIGSYELNPDHSYLFTSGDFIGNGKDELLAINIDTGESALLYYMKGIWNTYWSSNQYGGLSNYIGEETNILVGDVSGNGMDELYIFYPGTRNAWLFSYVSEEKSWNLLWKNPDTTKNTIHVGDVAVIGDFKGDGQQNLFSVNTLTKRAYLYQFNNNHWNLIWDNGNTGAIDRWHINKHDTYVVGDFTGNGNDDIFCLATNGWSHLLEFTDGSFNHLWGNEGSGSINRWQMTDIIVYDEDPQEQSRGSPSGWVHVSHPQYLSGYFNQGSQQQLLCINDGFGWAQIATYSELPNFYNMKNTVVADFNNDGYDDIILQNTVMGDKTLFISGKDNTLFSEIVDITEIGETNQQDSSLWNAEHRILHTGFLTDSGCTDLLAQGRTIHDSTYYLKGRNDDALFNDRVSITTRYGMNAEYWADSYRKLYTGDFNGDGFTDILLQGRSSSDDTILLIADGNGEYKTKEIITNRYNMNAEKWMESNHVIHIGDFNGNGCSDILLQGKTDSDDSYLLLGRKNGNVGNYFAPAQTITRFYDMDEKIWSYENNIIHIGDFNGDNRMDVLLQSRFEGSPSYLLTANTFGIDVFRRVIPISDAHGIWVDEYRKLHLGDFNGDGCTDILLQNRIAGDESYMIFGTPSGTWYNRIRKITDLYGMNTQLWDDTNRKITLADFNGDGCTDILLQGRNLEQQSYLIRSRGNGDFYQKASVPVSSL